jgi:putative IMPACT (imprinted ancient) family translation regulator
VIRYYGGTKLGVGGLVRAYTSGIKQGLRVLETVEKKRLFPGSLTCDYQQIQDVEHLLHKYQAEIHQRLFTDKIQLSFAIPRLGQTALALDLAAMSQGRLQAKFSL